MTTRVYLDWNATTPLRVEARDAMAAACDLLGNPSSVHAEGRAARRAIENARELVAGLVGADPRNVIFTSGGSEANVLALSPAIIDGNDRRPREQLFVSAIEHASVLAGGRFVAEHVQTLPVTVAGEIDLAALEQRSAALQARRIGFLASVMLANNETGVIQPIQKVAEIVHRHGGLLHVDAVQGPGRIDCNIGALGADLLTLSAHKFGGPKGAGALVKARASLEVGALLRGGGQERGARGGTENLAGIAGFGAAALAARNELATAQRQMEQTRAYLEQNLRRLSPGAIIFGETSQRLPNTTLFAVPGIKAETALIALDLDGFAVSAGSACSSGKVAPSHVLAAMAVAKDLAGGAIRVSIGATTTRRDVDLFLGAWERRLRTLHKEASKDAA